MKGWGESGCNGLSVFWLANVANYFSGNHAGIFLTLSDLIFPEIEIIMNFAFQLVVTLVSGHSLTQQIQITSTLPSLLIL